MASFGSAGFTSSACCHNKRPEARRRGNDVCLRKFWRAHKGWTVLSLSHWRTAGAERASGTGEDQGDAQSIQIPLSDFGRRKKLSSENVFSYRRHKVEDKRGEQPPFSVCGDGATQGTHKCERRARKRLRCRETKLAAHLGCRSHQWKMQTSSPNFSSGKTCFFYTAFYLRGSHYSTTNKTVRLLRNCSKIYQESISINRCSPCLSALGGSERTLSFGSVLCRN